jgi:hypothetical protein
MRLVKFALICAAISGAPASAQSAFDLPGPAIPKVWDEAELAA